VPPSTGKVWKLGGGLLAIRPIRFQAELRFAIQPAFKRRRLSRRADEQGVSFGILRKVNRASTGGRKWLVSSITK